jgi:hypothetical protein
VLDLVQIEWANSHGVIQTLRMAKEAAMATLAVLKGDTGAMANYEGQGNASVRVFGYLLDFLYCWCPVISKLSYLGNALAYLLPVHGNVDHFTE